MTTRIVRTRTWVAATGLLLPLGCALHWQKTSEQPPSSRPVALRVHVASVASREAYTPMKDEAGHLLYVAPEPLLTEADVRSATAIASERRALVRIEFFSPGAHVLELATMTNVGHRLAVFVDGELVMSPVVPGPNASGAVLLDGGFTRERADAIARGLTAGERSRAAPGAGSKP